jgi:C4-dicarboxylate-specific signal transduction histidine kinase
VAVQQSHAHAAGISEDLHLAELVDDALSFSQVQLDDDGVAIERDYEDLPPMSVDRHKVLQILIQVLSNARDALAGATGDKTITLRLRSDAGGGALVEVSDSGSGIAAENLPRIFNHGFTTKKDGHGFGLHASACAAMAMGGQLLARSDGTGRGATLTLHLASNVQCVTTHIQVIPDFDGSRPRSMP